MNKKSTRIGDTIVRGKKKSALGENHTALYIENVDGTPASGDYINNARKFARTLINLAISTKCDMPKKWGDADVWFQQLFYTALRKRFPLFQLCHNNAKANLFMQHMYYDAVTRKWENLSTGTVNLNDAKFVFQPVSDDDGVQEDVVDVPASNPPSSTAQRGATKRPSGVTLLPSKPAHSPRTRADEPEQSLPPSQPDKGKGRASAGLLSLISPSYVISPDFQFMLITLFGSFSSTMQPTPRVEDQPTTSTTASPPSQESPALQDAQGSVMPGAPSFEPPSCTAETTPALAASDGHPPTSHLDHPALPVPQTHLQHPKPPSEALGTHHNVPDMQRITPAALPTANAGPSDSLVDPPPAPSTSAIVTASKKTRAPRKAPQWPPPADLGGAKWAHARHWYAQTHGSEADFEQHYKAMSRADRQKAPRHAGQ
ncbi:hypothetical protein BD309DRAFT_874889 [Dichomitus squalens]|nr:hypothetical protein BD309DRAFT_874889 [Dichomitus squalens]